MEVVLEAGRLDTSSGDEMRMTGNPTMNEASEKIGSSGFESRDRRKSKYLSSPYTNMGPRHKGLPTESEDMRTPCLSRKSEASSTMKNALNRTPSGTKLGSKRCCSHKTEASSTTPHALNRTPSGAKLGNKRFRRNWHRKFISSSAIPNSTEFINASPAELLSGLYLKAVDCMFPMEDKSFDLVEWFFCRYRVSKYHEEAELATSMVNVNEENIGKPVDNYLQNTKTEKRRVYNRRENTVRRKMKSLSGLSDVNISSSTSDCLRNEGKLKQKRKVEEVTPLQHPQNVEITLNVRYSKHSSVPETPQIFRSDSLRPGGEMETKRKVEEVTSLQQLQNMQITLNESNGKSSSVPEIPQIPQISTSDSLRPEEKVKQKRMMEEVIQLQQPQNVEIAFNANNGKHSSVPEVPQISASNSPRPGGKEKQKRKVEDGTPLQWPQNGDLQRVEITSNGTNGKYCLVPDVPQSLTCFASENSAYKRRKEVDAAPLYQSVLNGSVNSGVEITKCSKLVIDLQLMSPSITGPVLQKCNGENKEELVLAGSNPESCVSQEKLGDFTNHDLSTHTSSKVGTVSANETGLKGKMEKVAEGHLSNKLAAEIPDLNCTITELNTTQREYENVNMLSPEVKLEQPRIVSAYVKPPEPINRSSVKDNGEADGTCLLLLFSPGGHLPSKEDLMSTFFRFGPLKASETKLLKDTCSAQIVFVRSADARSAFDSLDQSKPFGTAIADFKLINLPAACPPVEQQVVTMTQPTTRLTPFITMTQVPIMPTPMASGVPTMPTPMASGVPTMPTPMASGANPPLHVIKQNLQMMASMLEKSGNNLSPDMRTKLDSELKSLLKKVNSRAGLSPEKSQR